MFIVELADLVWEKIEFLGSCSWTARRGNYEYGNSI